MTRSMSAKISARAERRFWRSWLQLGEDRARFGVRRDWTLGDVLSVIRDPIGELVQMLAEGFRKCHPVR